MRRLSKVQNTTNNDSVLRTPSSIKDTSKTFNRSIDQSYNKKVIRDADLDDYETSEDENEEIIISKTKKRMTSKNPISDATFFNILTGRNSKLTGIDSEEEELELPAGVQKPVNYLKNLGPVRVEAKVWLANERTFNRWLSITTLLSILTFSSYK